MSSSSVLLNLSAHPGGGQLAGRWPGAAPGRRRRRPRLPGHCPAAVVHHDDERPGFARGNQVVHDQVGLALIRPAGFVLSAAVLEIQHRIAGLRVVVVARRRVDETAPHGVVHLGVVDRLADLAVRDVLEGVEVLVLGRYFDAAAPAARAVEVEAVWVRDLRAVHPELVVMEPFVLGRRITDPDAVRTLGEGIPHGADIEQDALRVRRDEAGADPALGIDLRILLAGLVRRCRPEVVHGRHLAGRCRVGRRLARLRQTRLPGDQEQQRQRTHRVLHRILLEADPRLRRRGSARNSRDARP